MDMDAAPSSMFTATHTPSTIPCCLCSAPILPSSSANNMCGTCLRSQTNITANLPAHLSVSFCPDCSSYHTPPRQWTPAALESPQLLSILLRRVTIPRNLRLVNAQFVWTEPHSKRIQLKLRVQSQLAASTVVEQSHLVEFVVHDHLCDSCSRASANPDQWVAKVQLRQHVSHRRTFFYLEQLILKHRAADRAIRIKETDQGIDFMFSNRSHGVKFVEFVSGIVPVQSRSDKSLVSQDSKNNTYNYHHTFSVTICPICREDLICLPPILSKMLGNFGPVVICTKVTNSIALMDPRNMRTVYLDAEKYWRMPFKAMMTSRQLVEYVVLYVEVEEPEVIVNGSKYCLAEVQVARVSDFGKNDNIFTVRTHLGHILHEGDYAFGYDLYGANPNDDELEKYKDLVLPEAILIKKSYEEKRQRKKGKRRNWKLKSLNMEVDTTTKGKIDMDERDKEYEQFLRDLEENPEIRLNVSLYGNKDYQPSETASTIGGDDLPTVPLDELLAELDLSDENEEDGGEDGMTE